MGVTRARVVAKASGITYARSVTSVGRCDLSEG